MPRFRIDPKEIKDGKILLDGKESRHAISVLRLKINDPVDLIDGQGNSFNGVVSGDQNGRLMVRVSSGVFQNDPHLPQITLVISAIKPERMELLIQKACELGAYRIIPVRTDRSIIKLSKERWQEKVKRWQKIASESCKQCGLARVPEVGEVADYKGIFSEKDFDLMLIPTLAVKTEPLYDKLPSSGPLKKILVLIGPEGDFTEKEVEFAVSFGAQPVSLGPLVLRTETAGIYMMSVLNFLYGRDPKKGKA